MRGLIRIDVGMLDDALGCVRWGRLPSGSRAGHRLSEKVGAQEMEIYVAPAGNLYAFHSFHGGQLRRNFLRNLAGRPLQPLGQLEANGCGHFTHFDPRRAFGYDDNV